MGVMDTVVYVLIEHSEYEGSHLCGIYSTYEAACKASAHLRNQFAVIEEWRLDGMDFHSIGWVTAYKRHRENKEAAGIPEVFNPPDP